MPSIGEVLRRQRSRRGQTPAEAAEAAGLTEGMVGSLEGGTQRLDDVRLQAYLRMYARHLGLDAEALLRDLDGGAGPPGGTPAGPGEEPAAPSPAMPPSDRGGARQWAVPVGLALLGVLTCAVMVWLVLWDRGATPSIQLTAPSGASGEVPTPPADREPPPSDATPGPRETQQPAPDPRPTASASIDPAAAESPQAGHPENDDPAPDETLRAPEDTRVQVLHNGMPAAVVAEVEAVLEALGYQVMQVNAARMPFEQTTVFSVDGWEAEGEALRDRDGRFGHVEDNTRFSTDVDLHVAVGPDWESAAVTPPEPRARR